MLQLNNVTFGARMRGRTAWTADERERISSTLGIETSDANLQVEQLRAERRTRREEGE